MRRYTAVIDEATLTTAHQIAKVLAPSDLVVGIVGVVVTTDSEAADAWDIQIGRATGGGTATAITSQKSEPGDATATALVYDITADTEATSFLEYYGELGDPRKGFIFQRAPEDALWLAPSEVFIVDSNIDVTSITLKCVIEFIELG